MIDAVAPDYLDRITFLAVAGKSTPGDSAKRVGNWFSPDRLLWGYDDDLWADYGVPYQPTTVLVSSDNVIVGGWPGSLNEADLRAELDRLAAIG